MSADGKWTTKISTPMGDQNGSMELATDGSSLTGTLIAANGDAIEITDGATDGNNLSWKAALTQPMPITLEFSAVIDGDSISGEVTLGQFGSGTLTGDRA